jgi:hypothetical protein
MIKHLSISQIKSLPDTQLIRYTDLDQNISDLEKELVERLANVVGKGTYEEGYNDCEKSYGSFDEQSEFRRQLIEDIQNSIVKLLPRHTETKDLIKTILNLIDESYVEL